MHMTVERVSYLHEQELNDYMNEIKHSFRADIQEEAQLIQKAVSFVRSGAVSSYTYDEAQRLVMASVVENEEDAVSVQLSFNKMEIACTCGRPTWCAHRLAVTFHLFLQYHSLTDWLQDWRRIETEQMALKIAERTPSAWNLTLSNLMNPIRIIGLNENPAVFIHKFSMIEQKATPLYPFEWEWKPLFDVYYRLHALEAAWPYIYFHLGEGQSSFSYGKWYVKNWLTEQLGKINDDIKSIAAKPKLFETDAFHEELKGLVRKLALENKGLFKERFNVYRSFWQNFFIQKNVRAEEKEILKQETATDAPMLNAFFYVIEGENEKLAELSKNLSKDAFGKWLPLATLAEYEDNIDALHIIMQSLLPYIGDYLTQNVPIANRSSFVRRIDGLLEAAEFAEDEREAMFSHYGETGVDVYADFLVERQRFKEWAALMHRYRVPYEIAEAGGLKIALTVDPAATLSLLHLYATGFIEERNRQSYRRAVNIFRKMKAGSKKAGKHDFWNLYIEAVREKNRRLRALMEEMEKGNLYL